MYKQPWFMIIGEIIISIIILLDVLDSSFNLHPKIYGLAVAVSILLELISKAIEMKKDQNLDKPTIKADRIDNKIGYIAVAVLLLLIISGIVFLWYDIEHEYSYDEYIKDLPTCMETGGRCMSAYVCELNDGKITEGICSETSDRLCCILG